MYCPYVAFPLALAFVFCLFVCLFWFVFCFVFCFVLFFIKSNWLYFFSIGNIGIGNTISSLLANIWFAIDPLQLASCWQGAKGPHWLNIGFLLVMLALAISACAVYARVYQKNLKFVTCA